MRLVAISLLVLAAWAIEEPEPISEEEQHDEVAQAQQRAKWLACLLLTRQVVVDGVSDLAPVLESSKHTPEATLRKIKSDIMWKCTEGMSNSVAERLLSSEVIDLADPDLKSFLEIDKAALQDAKSDITPTKEQLALFEAIKFEANRTDDGFEQEPPVVEDFDPSSYGTTNELGINNTVQTVSLAAGGAVFLGLLFVCNSLSRLETH